ncbi:multicopper oxidase family protein [Pyruvatibacter sp.]|uniref:multicopper oxidase family protein n=1 Tax=Pyruvatibacter sp. TaxID=1981328 RepID=UPI003267DFA3
MNRRQFLLGSGAVGAAGLTLAAGGSQFLAAERGPISLRSRMTSHVFNRPGVGSFETQGLISLADKAPPPVVRLTQGERAVIRMTNGLEDYTTMHWHGIRLPNAMDGVPYLTQFPIGQDETFEYAYTPPDAGTYWYHPHCMTMNQMALGLTGLLIVEEPEDVGFDLDVPLNLKDFRLDAEGQLRPFFTPRGAARGGTLGNVSTTNWSVEPIYDVPSGGLVRLRFAATDTTRIYKLAFPDVPGRIIAWDGHPVEENIAWPTADKPLWLGPGQRMDVALRVPDSEGSEVSFTGQFGTSQRTVVTLRATGASRRRDLAELKPLPRNPIAEPDVANAEIRQLVFGWTPDGKGANNGLCGSYGYTFWSIDRSPWPGDAVEGVGPLATLELGKSYILRLKNESPNLHPIHLHGLVFKPLRSNQRQLPGNYTDTILLMKNEVVDIALKADNPGDWAFHCHVIEHQKTGLAGYIRVA